MVGPCARPAVSCGGRTANGTAMDCGLYVLASPVAEVPVLGERVEERQKLPRDNVKRDLDA